MKPINIIILLIALLQVAGQAQTELPRGLILDEEEYEQLPHSSENIRFKSGQKALVPKVDLTRYCPQVQHQGEISSCVGWSLGYGVMTIERAIQHGWTDPREITNNANSALYIFNQVSQGNCNSGITFTDALGYLSEDGNCLAKDFRIDVNDCQAPVPRSVETYAIEHYEPLFRSRDPAKKKIRKTRMVLAQNKPVAIGMIIRNNFMQLNRTDEQWRPRIGDTTYASGHAMLVVGYDDNRFARSPQGNYPDMRGAFKIMNSWGREWGQNGFIWVRYRYFAEFCKQAFAIVMQGGEPIVHNEKLIAAQDTRPPQTRKERTTQSNEYAQQSDKDLSGAFGFRRFSHWDGNEPVFEESPVTLQDNQYLLQGNHQVGDRFQLYVENGFDQGYIYVFSIDAKGKAEVHFPRSESYSPKFAGQEQSALIWESGSELIIPTANSTLDLEKRGKDHLVALYCTSKLNPQYLQQLMDLLAEDPATVRESLSEILGKYAVAPTDIQYAPNAMAFRVTNQTDGRIIPVILEVAVN